MIWGGPAISLALTGNRLQASSPSVDLDGSTWRYYKIPHRRQTYICDYLDYPPEPTGESSVIENVQDGDWYCFWAFDKQGHRNTRLIQIDLSQPIKELQPVIALPPVVDDQRQATSDPVPTPELVLVPQPQQPADNQPSDLIDNQQISGSDQPAVTETVAASDNTDDQQVFNETAITLQQTADTDDSGYPAFILIILGVVVLAIAAIVAIIIYSSAAKTK